MKNLYLKAGKTKDVFTYLKDNFKGTLTAVNNKFNLNVASNVAKGNIIGIPFSDGITFLQFDIVFYDDFRLSMEPFTASPILFGYCLQGTLQHSFGEKGERKNIKKNQTAILKSTSSVNSIFHFEKNKPLKFYVIQIETNRVATSEHNEEVMNRLKKLFFNTKEDYLDINNQSIKIRQQIEELNTMTHKGIIGNLMINRILDTIIAVEIKEHTDRFALMAEMISSFTLNQIEDVRRISNNVINLSLELFTTDFLIQKISLFTHKLQKEFKIVMNRTVHDFLIYIRIERGGI